MSVTGFEGMRYYHFTDIRRAVDDGSAQICHHQPATWVRLIYLLMVSGISNLANISTYTIAQNWNFIARIHAELGINGDSRHFTGKEGMSVDRSKNLADSAVYTEIFGYN
jgi:hypothetical protein